MQHLDLDQLNLSAFRKVGRIPAVSDELLSRIRDIGIIEPVVVRPSASNGPYEVLSHPEFVVAAGRLSLQKIPVVIRDDLSDADAQRALSSQFAAVAGNPIEEAELFRQELGKLSSDKKPSKARLASWVGKTRPYVSRSLALLELPAAAQDAIRVGRLSAGHGHVLVTIKDKGRQDILTAEALTEKLTVRELRDRSRESSVDQPTKTTVAVHGDADMRHLEEAVSMLLGSKVKIDAVAGTMTVDYYGNLEILEGILERLGYKE